MTALEATLPRNELLAALKWAALGVPRRPPIQVLTGVRLTAGAGAVTVSGFDYEVVASQWITAPGARGEALVHHASLTRMISALPKGCDVRLDVVGERLRVTAADTRMMLPLLPLADYPALPVIDPTATAHLTGEQWRQMIRPCTAVGRDSTLPVLTGLLIESHEGRLCTAATDRYRLGVQDVGVPWGMGEKMLVPAAVLTGAARLLGRNPDKVVIAAERREYGGRFGLTCGSRTLQARGLEGEFPKYRPLIPDSASFARMLEFPRPEVLAAVERVRTAGARLSPLRLTVQGGDALLIEAGNDVDSDTYAAAEVHGVKVLKADDPIDLIALNDGYLRDGLLAFTDDTVLWATKNGTSPQVFRAAAEPGFTYLLMPVKMYD